MKIKLIVLHKSNKHNDEQCLFETIDNIVAGRVGTEHRDYTMRLANRGLTMEESMKNIVGAEFPQIGDFQTKLRSGAFAAKNISFDMDETTVTLSNIIFPETIVS